VLVAECAVFVVVFVAVCAAFTLGRGSGAAQIFRYATLLELHRYDPAIEVLLEYRYESGSKSLRRVHITRCQRRYDGRLYLVCYCHRSNGPRTFRVDRIISFATLDGEVIDRYQFLIDRLSISKEFCANVAEPFTETAAAQPGSLTAPNSCGSPR